MAATPAMTKEALAEDVGEAAAEEEEEEAFVEAFGVDVAAFEAAFEEARVVSKNSPSLRPHLSTQFLWVEATSALDMCRGRVVSRSHPKESAKFVRHRLHIGYIVMSL